MSDENQGQRRNSSPMQADSTQKLEPVLQVLRCVFRRRGLPVANRANLPSRHSHKTKQSSSSKTTHSNPRLSLLKMVFQFLLKCSTPPLPSTHTHTTVHLSQPPSLTLTLQQHQDIVLLDGSLHHQRGSTKHSGGAIKQSGAVKRCRQAKRGSSLP